MKRMIFWLATAVAAFSLGRRAGSKQRMGSDDAERLPEGAEDGRGRSRVGPLLQSLGAGLSEAWSTAARQYEAQRRRERREALSGRLGGAAGSAAWVPGATAPRA